MAETTTAQQRETARRDGRQARSGPRPRGSVSRRSGAPADGAPPGGRGARRSGARRTGDGARRSGAAPRLHLGRIAVLLLFLIGASFYVSPLRAFFTQQDRYRHESDALAAARVENEAYKVQVELLTKKDYVAQLARADSMLVPPDTQVFVIKGLPEAAEEPVAERAGPVSAGSISVFDRLDDLWRTLVH